MGRGRFDKKTLAFMAVIQRIVQDLQPITVRGIAYKLFIQGAIPTMASKHTKRVSRVTTQMREEGYLPWS